MTELSLPPQTWEELAQNPSLPALCLRLPHLHTIIVKDASSLLLDKLRGLPARVTVIGTQLGRILKNPSKLASFAGFAPGELFIPPGDSLANCMNRIGRKAYNVRPVAFDDAQISDEEMALFMPYLSPLTTEIEIGHLNTTFLPLQWPSNLKKLVCGNGASSSKGERYHLPATLETLIVHHNISHASPRLDLSLPTGLTRLEISDLGIDYVFQFPPSLRRLTAWFHKDSLIDNLKAMPSTLCHLKLENGFEIEDFDYLPKSLTCLECVVPYTSEFENMARTRGIVWINSGLVPEATLDDIWARSRQS